MKGVFAIARRELLSYFVSPIAYLAITGFLLLGGYFFFWYLAEFNTYLFRSQQMLGQGPSLSLNQIVEAYYRTLSLVLVFLVPLLTMRLFAEERRNGTFELLITSPVSIFSIVFGKFLGLALTLFVMVFLASTFPGFLIVYANPEIPPIFSGLLGITLLAIGFGSIAMAVASFSESQVIAGTAGLVTLLLFYVISAQADNVGGTFGEVLRYLSPIEQSDEMMKGVISLKSIVYFLSLISLGLFLSFRAVELERYR
jgi:ABC-2 type transport system permease protein